MDGELMTSETIDGITVLHADEGLVLYLLEDGTEVGQTAWLGSHDSAANYGEREHIDGSMEDMPQ